MKQYRSKATACTLLAALLLACAESEVGETANPIDAWVGRSAPVSSAGGGGSGGAGSGRALPIDLISRAGAGPSGLERCSGLGSAGSGGAAGSASNSPPATDADAAPRVMVGLSSVDERARALIDYQETTLEGRVTQIRTDRMEIETRAGSLTFGWRGPSLAASFDVGEAVQVVTRFVDKPLWSIIRSERATAATVVGGYFGSLSKQPGSTTTLHWPEPGFPELVYGLVSCCSLGAPFNQVEQFECDYSKLDGDSAAIARGATGSVGPWSVTNLSSTYYEQLESSWSLQATLLGPATPRSLEGGL